MNKRLFLDLAIREGMRPSPFVEVRGSATRASNLATALSTRPDEYVSRDDGTWTVRCGACGVEYGIGEAVCCPHGRATPSKGFEPRFDVGLGREVTGWGDIHQAMREEHLDYRERASLGTRNDRVDRCRERREVR